MTTYIVIELPDGLEPVEMPENRTPAEIAAENGGVIVDEGPFASLDEANDAIDNLKAEMAEDA